MHPVEYMYISDPCSSALTLEKGRLWGPAFVDVSALVEEVKDHLAAGSLPKVPKPKKPKKQKKTKKPKIPNYGQVLGVGLHSLGSLVFCFFVFWFFGFLVFWFGDIRRGANGQVILHLLYES